MKAFLLTALSTLLLAPSFAQPVKSETYRIKEGDKLTYHVEAGEQEYDFIVKVRQLDSTVAFDYEMTAPASREGSVSMDADAMKAGMALYNYFSGGPVALHDETSVFVSKDLYSKVISSSSVSIPTDGKDSAPEEFTKLSGMESLTNGSLYLDIDKKVAGKPMSLAGPILENADGSHAIRIQQTDYFPIITYMQIGFKIYLTGIERS